jgi:hypothetical protein
MTTQILSSLLFIWLRRKTLISLHYIFQKQIIEFFFFFNLFLLVLTNQNSFLNLLLVTDAKYKKDRKQFTWKYTRKINESISLLNKNKMNIVKVISNILSFGLIV